MTWHWDKRQVIGTREDLKHQPWEELEGQDSSKCLQLHIGTLRAVCLGGSHCNLKEPDSPKDPEVTACTCLESE